MHWLVAEGVATGIPDGTFRPDAPITRAQPARMLYRMSLDWCGGR